MFINHEGKWKWYMYNNDFVYLCPKFITSSPTVQKSVLHTQIWTILVFAWKIFQWEARRWTYTWWNKILACSSMFRSWWCQWYTIKSKINKPSYKWTPQNLAVGRDKVWLWATLRHSPHIRRSLLRIGLLRGLPNGHCPTVQYGVIWELDK